MSIIVKNLNLPESCSQCRFLAYDDYSTGCEYECTALKEFMNEDELPEGRRSDCPLSDAGEEFMKHYRQGREDGKAEANGTLMQAFNTD